VKNEEKPDGSVERVTSPPAPPHKGGVTLRQTALAVDSSGFIHLMALFFLRETFKYYTVRGMVLCIAR
jgi:hypothetical protein